MKTAKPKLAALRVAKTYSPDQNGAKRFSKRYGDSLVCVRHRLSNDGTIRHATVELLIESTPVTSRARSLVAVKIAAADKNTRTLLMACGALWVSKEKYWIVPRLVAKNLRLLRFDLLLPATFGCGKSRSPERPRACGFKGNRRGGLRGHMHFARAWTQGHP